MAINKSDISLGFWIAVGFFIFGLVMALAQYMMTRLRQHG